MNNWKPSGPRPTLLCIDDDPAIAAALSIRLRPFNVEVTTASFGEQGIWLAVTDRPDVIITDLRMPQGQGDYVVEFLKSRADTRDVPVIVLTGCRDPQTAKRMHALGVEHYLHKPVLLISLLDALAAYIPLEQRSKNRAAAR